MRKGRLHIAALLVLSQAKNSSVTLNEVKALTLGGRFPDFAVDSPRWNRGSFRRSAPSEWHHNKVD